MTHETERVAENPDMDISDAEELLGPIQKMKKVHYKFQDISNFSSGKKL